MKQKKPGDALYLEFGHNWSTPSGIKACWGARLIYPNDLVWDRKSSAHHKTPAGERELERLKAWLDGKDHPEQPSPLVKVLSDDRIKQLIRPDQSMDVVLYDDTHGRIVGNAHSSHGYVYVIAYLKPKARKRAA